MLERQSFHGSPAAQGRDLYNDEPATPLSPSYIIEIAKRRALYFLIPFVLIALIGSLVTLAWPSRYLAQGTILVSSQEIPSDLVRPTVAALANDRIQTIQQRIMTRDNLLAIAKKFQIRPFWQGDMSGSDLVEFIRSRVQIAPVKDDLLAGTNPRKNAIAFTVGFEYEKPQVAAGVANELVTMILNEDVRSRTDFATQTTRFLEQEVQRLEDKLGQINNQINEFSAANPGAMPNTGKGDTSTELTALKNELLIKSATLSDQHPEIKALKRKIQALEKAQVPTVNPPADVAKAVAQPGEKKLGIDTLETQRSSVKDELTNAIQKVSAARMGESMERSQQSERLEVIEQPSIPQRSIKPNKPKVFALVFALALVAGGGLAFAAETLDKSIRRRSELYSVVDSQLVFAIPYITAPTELVTRKRKLWLAFALAALLIAAAAVALIFVLPPIDVLMEKVLARVTR
jgi:uncharacterized protein involved in exopolysaccharide biosynthesis